MTRSQLTTDWRKDLPTPAFRLLELYENEEQPFRRIHRLIDTLEWAYKWHTVIAVSDLLANFEPSPRIKLLLSRGLQTPSLGTWLLFFIESVKANGDPCIDWDSSSCLRQVESKYAIVKLRNRYAHGATPSDDECLKDCKRAEPAMLQLLESEFLLNTCLICSGGDTQFLMKGAQPRSVQEQLAPGHAAAVLPDGTLVDLWPLGICDENGKGGHDWQFFFFNALRARQVEELNYEFSLIIRRNELWTPFHQALPLEEWEADLGADLVHFRSRIDALASGFVGRERELRQLREFVAEGNGVFLLLGSPGIGKSSLLAQLLLEIRSGRDRAGAALSVEPVHLFSYFIQRGSIYESALQFLTMLNLRLDEAYSLRNLPVGDSDVTAHHGLALRLDRIDNVIGPRRFVLQVDGLDESSSIIRVLPEPRGWLAVICSSRPSPDVRATVETRAHGEAIVRELEPLGNSDIRALLYGAADRYDQRMSSEYVEAVSSRSGGYPLYMKLMCDQLLSGELELGDFEILPTAMESMFGRAVQGVTDNGLNEDVLNVLCGLAVAREAMSSSTIAHFLGVNRARAESAVHACASLLSSVSRRPTRHRLFHTGFREWLRTEYESECRRVARLMADECSRWGNGSSCDEWQEYAMEFGVQHLLDVNRHVAAYQLLRDDAFRKAQKSILRSPARIRPSFEQLISALAGRDSSEESDARLCWLLNACAEMGEIDLEGRFPDFPNFSKCSVGDVEKFIEDVEWFELPKRRGLLLSLLSWQVSPDAGNDFIRAEVCELLISEILRPEQGQPAFCWGDHTSAANILVLATKTASACSLSASMKLLRQCSREDFLELIALLRRSFEERSWPLDGDQQLGVRILEALLENATHIDDRVVQTLDSVVQLNEHLGAAKSSELFKRMVAAVEQDEHPLPFLLSLRLAEVASSLGMKTTPDILDIFKSSTADRQEAGLDELLSVVRVLNNLGRAGEVDSFVAEFIKSTSSEKLERVMSLGLSHDLWGEIPKLVPGTKTFRALEAHLSSLSDWMRSTVLGDFAVRTAETGDYSYATSLISDIPLEGRRVEPMKDLAVLYAQNGDLERVGEVWDIIQDLNWRDSWRNDRRGHAYREIAVALVEAGNYDWVVSREQAGCWSFDTSALIELLEGRLKSKDVLCARFILERLETDGVTERPLVCVEVAGMLWDAGWKPEALSLLKASIAFNECVTDSEIKAEALTKFVEFVSRSECDTDLVALLDELEAEARRFDDPRLWAYLAQAHEWAGHYEASEDAYIRAAKRALDTNRPDLAVQAEQSLCRLYCRQEHWLKALQVASAIDDTETFEPALMEVITHESFDCSAIFEGLSDEAEEDATMVLLFILKFMLCGPDADARKFSEKLLLAGQRLVLAFLQHFNLIALSVDMNSQALNVSTMREILRAAHQSKQTSLLLQIVSYAERHGGGDMAEELVHDLISTGRSLLGGGKDTTAQTVCLAAFRMSEKIKGAETRCRAAQSLMTSGCLDESQVSKTQVLEFGLLAANGIADNARRAFWLAELLEQVPSPEAAAHIEGIIDDILNAARSLIDDCEDFHREDSVRLGDAIAGALIRAKNLEGFREIVLHLRITLSKNGYGDMDAIRGGLVRALYAFGLESECSTFVADSIREAEEGDEADSGWAVVHNVFVLLELICVGQLHTVVGILKSHMVSDKRWFAIALADLIAELSARDQFYHAADLYEEFTKVLGVEFEHDDEERALLALIKASLREDEPGMASAFFSIAQQRYAASISSGKVDGWRYQRMIKALVEHDLLDGVEEELRRLGDCSDVRLALTNAHLRAGNVCEAERQLELIRNVSHRVAAWQAVTNAGSEDDRLKRSRGMIQGCLRDAQLHVQKDTDSDVLTEVAESVLKAGLGLAEVASAMGSEDADVSVAFVVAYLDCCAKNTSRDLILDAIDEMPKESRCCDAALKAVLVANVRECQLPRAKLIVDSCPRLNLAGIFDEE
jgi:hypothetical protein